jgi:hypothetical protein
MPQIIIPNVWIMVVSGAVIWFIGDTMKRRQSNKGSSSFIGNTLALFGLIAFGLGVYAGFRGPVNIGSLTLEKFSFSNIIQQTNEKATSYAQSQLQLSSEPAGGWRGSSTRSLLYTVQNKGDRTVLSLILRFGTDYGSSGHTVDLTLKGPFPAKQTTKAAVDIPPNVSRSYFQAMPRISNSHIVGARF